MKGSAGQSRRGVLRGLIAALLLVALAAGQARAETDEALDLRYRFTWAGVPIATLGLRHVTNAVLYQTELEIRTIGLVDQLFSYRSLARATGAYEAPDRFTASRYRSAYTSYRKSRRILIRFDPDTGDVTRLELTRNGEPDRSKVPEALQKGVVDPLTALIQLRHRVTAEDGSGRYTAAVFDGRRRFDLKARVVGRGEADVAGRTRPVIKVEVGLRWIAGSNRDELEPATAEENSIRLEVLLSDDERLIPLRLRTMDSFFTAEAEVMPECLGPRGCGAASG